jgi:hypothetical protein
MNIDLPSSLAAFALESPAGSERVSAEPHTLTLRLTRAGIQPKHESMSGTASMQTLPLDGEGLLRATVLPAEGPALTITF